MWAVVSGILLGSPFEAMQLEFSSWVSLLEGSFEVDLLVG